jgi:iron complex outermembrane recepter protein
MRKNPIAMALIAAFPFATLANAQTAEVTTAPTGPVKVLGIITVSGGQPTSLPTHIPTTTEGITQEQIETTINATDSGDAIKYFPSLLVRKRYVGDYNHAVLSSRASGTGNSARSAVYADGILLSNYLGNGATYTPRWGLVTPEEIERVDVMYGPFSAAYPGNSVGAVVDYVTRMPTRLEGHAKLSYVTQDFDLYNTSDTFSAKQASASLGSRSGAFAWFLNANRTDSHGQPLTFVTKNATGGNGTTPVTGAVPGLDRSNNPWLIIGSGTEYETVQDHAKVKLAYDLTPTLRAAYTFGYWANEAENRSRTYLRDAAGNPVFSGAVQINGSNYTVGATDFNVTNETFEHLMHGLSLKSLSKGTWDWEVAGSLYDFSKDEQRTATTAQPAALQGGAGRITDQRGTGWSNIALKGIWRPQGVGGEHIADFGYQQDNYKLRILTSDIAGNWLSDGPGAVRTDVGGKTETQAVYAQDTWSFAPKWKTVLGARFEHWQASDGYTLAALPTPARRADYESRSEQNVSPKAALAYQLSSASVIKVSTGRAVRYPTVNELYGATSTGVLTVINDPNLRAEKSWTSELSLETDLGNGLLRTTLFFEDVRNSLYSQREGTVTRISNVGQIRTPGAELAYQGNDVGWRGLDLSTSLTYADSRIVKNDGFVTTPGDTIDKYQPRVPVWRATALASYRVDDKLTGSLGWRYSGKQYSTLNNSDPNGYAYQGSSPFKVVDLRLHYKIDKQWSAAFGIDNLTDYQYWNFHPYPQRSYSAEIKFDL